MFQATERIIGVFFVLDACEHADDRVAASDRDVDVLVSLDDADHCQPG